MPKNVRFLALGAAVIATLAPAGAALAQPVGNELVVQGHAFGLQDNQVVVPYRDLSVGDAAGRRALLQRVGFAIDSLCYDGAMSVTDPVNALKCSNRAWDSVRPQIDQIVAH